MAQTLSEAKLATEAALAEFRAAKDPLMARRNSQDEADWPSVEEIAAACEGPRAAYAQALRNEAAARERAERQPDPLLLEHERYGTCACGWPTSRCDCEG